MKRKIYTCLDIAVEPPQEYTDSLIKILDAFTKPYKSKSTPFYDEYKSIFGENTYQSYNPRKNEDTITHEVDLSDITTYPIQPNNIYFSRPGTITAFGESNDNDYLPNIRLKLPKIRMINITEPRVVPFTIQPNLDSDTIIEYENSDDFWVQYHPQSSINQVQSVELFLDLISN